MEISPGAIIAGRYRADRKIGAGSMGEVWAGENIAVGYKIAIKTMLQDASGDPEVIARFKREAFLLGRIRSDYVARVLDFATDERYGLVLILDLILGEAFSITLRRTKLTVEQAIDVGTDVVSGLCDLHRSNVVHRDLKPGNIILEPRAGGTQRAIIVDFGVSRLMKSQSAEDEEITNITRADMALGTLEYMAPEQMLDSRSVTGASDIYAVGAMLFRAVAGRHAFGDLADIELARMKLLSETPPLITGRSDEIAKGYEAMIGRALKRKPEERYKRAEEMLSDLLALRDLILKSNGRSAMPSIIDESTLETIANTLPIDIEVSRSFQVGGTSSSHVAPASATTEKALQVAAEAAIVEESAPVAAAEPAPAAAEPAPTAASQASQAALYLTPLPRRGVSTRLVVVLVLAALIAGVVIGVTLLSPAASSSGASSVGSASKSSTSTTPEATRPARTSPHLQRP